MNAPARIVSLVPSLTETLVAIGAGDRLVGRTRYCTEPAGHIETVAAVGGTKNPDLERIVALAPDLVVVNKEENRREDCEALVEAGLRLHVTHPRSVAAAIAMLRELGEVLSGLRPPRAPGEAADGRLATSTSSLPEPAAAAHRLADRCDAALGDVTAAARGRERPSVFCPIWRHPWMTFHDRTYVGDVLAVVGLRNVFGAPAERDFFEVDVSEVLARRPQIVVLPDEPYVFTSKHAEELRDAGLAGARFVLIDGKDLAWYGPRIPDALRRLAEVARAAVAD